MSVTDTDPGYARFQARIGGLEKLEIEVGVHGSEASATRDEGDESNAQIAARHEFGIGVPQRSFLARTVDGQASAIADEMQTAVGEVVAGSTAAKAMDRTGQMIEKMVKKTIQSGIPPPLSQMSKDVRVARLKAGKPANPKFGETDTPLILSGQMIESIVSRVRTK